MTGVGISPVAVFRPCWVRRADELGVLFADDLSHPILCRTPAMDTSEAAVIRESLTLNGGRRRGKDPGVIGVGGRRTAVAVRAKPRRRHPARAL